MSELNDRDAAAPKKVCHHGISPANPCFYCELKLCGRPLRSGRGCKRSVFHEEACFAPHPTTIFTHPWDCHCWECDEKMPPEDGDLLNVGSEQGRPEVSTEGTEAGAGERRQYSFEPQYLHDGTWWGVGSPCTTLAAAISRAKSTDPVNCNGGVIRVVEVVTTIKSTQLWDAPLRNSLKGDK